jgi:polyribonucleotide nucleotidyltransferase
MDFKVAGTTDGITAIQMDIKVAGITIDIMREALAEAKKSRLFIIDKLKETITEPRAELSEFAPRMIVLQISPDKIKDVIGPGGKVINKIVADTGVKIDIENDGRVFIAGPDAAGAEKAKNMVEALTKEVKIGEQYLGTVTRLMNFGAFVAFLPGKEGLVHISQLAADRVERVEDVVKPGDQIMVKVIEVDSQGRINLSRKAVLSGGGSSDGERTSGSGGDGGSRGNGAPPRREFVPRSGGDGGGTGGGGGGGDRGPRRRRPRPTGGSGE